MAKDNSKEFEEELKGSVNEFSGEDEQSGDMFNMDDAMETLRINPKSVSPFSVIKITDIKYQPKDLERNPKSKDAILFTVREKQIAGIAEQIIPIYNIFEEKYGTKNGRNWDLRKSGLIRLKHIFGALSSKQIELKGNLDLTDVDKAYKEVFQGLFSFLEGEDWRNLKLNIKFTMYKSVQFPLNPPFISSGNTNRLADIKWVTGTDFDVPQGGDSSSNGADKEVSDDKLPF